MTLATFRLSGQDFRLRRAAAADVGPIVELMAADDLRKDVDSADPGRRGAYLEAFERIDADPAQLLAVVTDEQDRVVATMQLTVIPGLARAGATRLQLEAVRVDSRLRSNGLGSAMMAWAVEEGRRRGASMVQLTSDKSRDAAHRFYERLGFTPSHVGFKLFL